MSSCLEAQYYHDKITALYDEYKDAKIRTGEGTSVSERIDNAEALTEQYYEAHSRRAPRAILSRLATYLLLDTLADTHPDKMARDEYPVMSYSQTGRYFARNGTLAPEPYTQESVMGRKSSTKEWGSDSSDTLLFADDPMLLDVINKADLYALLDNAKLTDRQRQAIDLVYFEDLTQEQAAEVMGVGRVTVATLIRRSLHYISESVNTIDD